MTEETPLLVRLLDAHDAVQEAQDELRRLAERRNRLVREALDAGLSAASLATFLHVHRSRIYQMSAPPTQEPQPSTQTPARKRT